MGDFFRIFVTSRNTEILIESNYWLRLYVPYILKFRLEYELHFELESERSITYDSPFNHSIILIQVNFERPLRGYIEIEKF